MKEKIFSYFRRLKYSYRHIPDKKVYLEFFTGLLSIPVLLTVILLNVHNLNGAKNDKTIPTPAEKQIIYISPNATNTAPTASPQVSQEACKKGIGPISISSPDEGDQVTDNPVSVIISYQQGNYCSVVWAYRINNGSWSGYDDKSLALYNLPSGKITLDLKVKSIVTGEEKQLQRIFTYIGETISTPSPVASSSAQ